MLCSQKNEKRRAKSEDKCTYGNEYRLRWCHSIRKMQNILFYVHWALRWHHCQRVRSGRKQAFKLRTFFLSALQCHHKMYSLIKLRCFWLSAWRTWVAANGAIRLDIRCRSGLGTYSLPIFFIGFRYKLYRCNVKRLLFIAMAVNASNRKK